MGCVLIKRSDQSMYGVLLTNIRDQYGCENNDPPPPPKKNTSSEHNILEDLARS